ncbi:hypothetical protein N0V88_007437 [Collariella sp. IMI 366227]|nr:hypothetical protein N0V88_007437 [Collariella sp. IMI 366227]
MSLETVRSPFATGDYTTLAEHQEQTPDSFATNSPREQRPEETVEQKVDLFVNSRNLSIFCPSAECGVSIPYQQISIHALKTLRTPDDQTFPSVYLQLELAEGGAGDDDFDTVELTLIPQQPPSTTTTPANTTKPEAILLFNAISECSNLNPDPVQNGDDENEDEYGDSTDAQIIFEGEAIEGFSGVFAGASDGGLPPAMPGSGGWITAENVHEFFDEEGNWIGGEAEEEGMRLPVRISVVCWAIGLVILLGYSISRLLFFVHIFHDHAGVAVSQPQVLAHANDSSPEVVPKIIHNIFHNWKDPGNEGLPAEYSRMRQTCIDLNPDFKFMLWSDKASRDFIEREYPWFLRTYQGYRYPVQRVDALKYFLMLHYGGIYMDLDNQQHPRRAPPPPLYHHLTLALLRYDWHWPLPFVRIMYASGQWFITAVWEEYHALLPRSDGKRFAKGATAAEHGYLMTRVLMDGREGADEWTFSRMRGRDVE